MSTDEIIEPGTPPVEPEGHVRGSLELLRQEFILESQQNGVDVSDSLPFSDLKSFIESFQIPASILQSISQGNNRIYAITGPIATGKSTLSQSIFQHGSVRKLNLPVDRFIYSRSTSN